jgi:hypothetical protein
MGKNTSWIITNVRGNEMVVTQQKVEGSYTDYYLATRSPKLDEPVDLNMIILEEATERHAYISYTSSHIP